MWGPEKAIFENLLFLFLETYDCWSEASSVSVVARACSSEFSCIVLYFCPFSKKKKLQAVNRLIERSSQYLPLARALASAIQ